MARELLLPLDPDPARPLHRQVYEHLRQAILSGRLRPGERLPSTRQAARRLRLARNTVARAYEDLESEGYLEGRVGSGTYVPRALPEELLHGAVTAEPAPLPALPSRPLSAWGTRAFVDSAIPQPSLERVQFDFTPGQPDWDAFPRALWRRLLGHAWLRGDLGRLGEPAGYRPLREALASYLAASRGVVCSAEQIVVVNGTQQALDLVGRLWLDPGQRVALESPGYPGARRAFQAYGAETLPLPVDAEGAQVDRLASMQGVRLVSVTPSHQYPTGAVLSLERRLRLLDWAERSGALVLEDDYDSEFRFAGRPLASLQGLDRGGRVIYLGTFSTVLLPPLRLGYAVLPLDLVDAFARGKSLADSQTATAEQEALAEMLRQGHFARHLRRMRRLYQERRAVLLAGLARHLGGLATWRDSGAGLHIMLTLRAGQAEADAAQRTAQAGIDVGRTAPCWVGAPEYAALLLGYTALPTDRIDAGLRHLARALEKQG